MTILRIKRWLIHKLGGFVFGDLPVDIAQDWLNRKASSFIDREMAERLKHGFTTKHL